MSAFFLHASMRAIPTPEQLRSFEPQLNEIRTIIESFGGAYRTRSSAVEIVEGDWDPAQMSLVEFPTMAALVAWHDSEEYRPWRELREARSNGDYTLVFEGVEPR